MKINTIDKIVYSKPNGEKINIPLVWFTGFTH
jgi:hypothetical protein